MKILDIIDKPTLVELCKPSDAVASRHLVYRIAGESLLFTAATLLFENWFLHPWFCSIFALYGTVSGDMLGLDMNFTIVEFFQIQALTKYCFG